ncbi:MAG TPA: heavy-metal-associated domain-containing protein [Ferruginibacter sp.]|nr:heavy-metal-associated domain-containing protein [Ferruginibacter sp.]HRQ20125.1 heavy-metal-associated domain-containing protein [Ferruginibacter sp.]
MKSIKFMLVAVCLLFASSVFAQEKTDTIKVSGECGMCKSRIQKALKLEGISSAIWDTETKLLTVTYSSDKLSNDDIQKKVAAVGHDTEKYKAEDVVYNKLPGCCKYERKEKN